MTTAEVGAGLVALCKEGKFDEAMEAYYGEGIVSIEYSKICRRVSSSPRTTGSIGI